VAEAVPVRVPVVPLRVPVALGVIVVMLVVKTLAVGLPPSLL
jgi:hypothetical protein